ncbi:MAG: hypothetical protein ACT4NY_23600 [Pseudonocardiales bacterium]
MRQLAAGPGLVYLFWPVALAYLRIATHSNVFTRPLEPGTARANLGALLDRAHVRCPGDATGFWATFRDTVGTDVIRGNLVTDAHIAALMRQHGVGSIWTADKARRRGLRRFIDQREDHDRRPARGIWPSGRHLRCGHPRGLRH